MPSKEVWVVRAGNNNEIATEVEKKSVVAIGWAAAGDIGVYKDREHLKTALRNGHPDWNDGKLNNSAGQIWRFAHEIREGDFVLTPIKATREVLIGKFSGPYQSDIKTISSHYRNVRRVNWLQRVSRDRFPADFKNALGSTLTVFCLTPYLEQLEVILKGPDKPPAPEPDGPTFFEETYAKGMELIQDAISKLDGYQMQELVAGVLKGMGYATRVSDPGPDRGIDIVAHPDQLGFKDPLIKVQVKHRKGSAGGPDLRNFLSTLGQGECGLFVSTGGFSKDAYYEAERSHRRVSLLDGDRFVDMLLEHYEGLDPITKAMIPLRKVYIPSN